MNTEEILSVQHRFFQSAVTRTIDFRKEALRKLKSSVRTHEQTVIQALQTDLGKSAAESYITEISLVNGEIEQALKNLDKWSRPKRRLTPLFMQPAVSRIYNEPYGIVLIIAPWNYPFQLTFVPLIGALAAGNCVILKPSPQAPATAEAMKNIIRQTFPPEYVRITDSQETPGTDWLYHRYDYIFYTGGPDFGKEVMQAAARHLTPVTLELGGKSPCIVMPDADISLAANRIVWGKFLNCGQTCVAPDYVLAHLDIRDELLNAMIKAIGKQFGTDPRQSPDYGRIINERHFRRLAALLSEGKIIAGGKKDESLLYIAPTILTDVSPEAPVMQEEIFGPILPVLEYNRLQEAVDFIDGREKPLALYAFTRNKKQARFLLDHTSSGGACINDVIMQLANNRLPFGGVGYSGMGAYHGEESFRTFSHRRSVVSTFFRLDLPLKYPPYRHKLKWLKKLM